MNVAERMNRSQGRGSTWLAWIAAAVLTTSCGGKPDAGHEPGGEHHDGEEGQHQERVVKLSAEQAEALGIKLVEAAPGSLRIYSDLPGEVVFDPERVTHVVPRVPGIVREVRKELGDPVRAGEVLAVLESRELAETKAAYLSRLSRLKLAAATHLREESLWKERISSEQEYLNARQALEEARVEVTAAEHQLHALGFSHESVERLPSADDDLLTRYEMTSPMDGLVIEKHAARGEALDAESNAFTIADLASVWVYLTVFTKDLALATPGKKVVIVATKDAGRTVEGTIDYVSPVVEEATRTTKARVVLDNADGAWRAGVFVTGRLLAEEVEVALALPASCLQVIGDETVVFVRGAEGFEARQVHIGRRTETEVEVLSGVEPGQEVVRDGSFVLKAEIEKAGFEEGHGH